MLLEGKCYYFTLLRWGEGRCLHICILIKMLQLGGVDVVWGGSLVRRLGLTSRVGDVRV